MASDQEEWQYCENQVGQLADERGLVVITPAVVEMLVRERQKAREESAAKLAELEGKVRKWKRRALAAARLTGALIK